MFVDHIDRPKDWIRRKRIRELFKDQENFKMPIWNRRLNRSYPYDDFADEFVTRRARQALQNQLKALEEKYGKPKLKAIAPQFCSDDFIDYIVASPKRTQSALKYLEQKLKAKQGIRVILRKERI